MRVRVGIGIALILLIGLIAGVGGIVTSDDRPPIGQAPPINNTKTADVVAQSQSQSPSESPQTYAVTADSADVIDTDQLAEYGEVGTQADERIELRMEPSDVTPVENISWVRNVRPVVRPEPAQTDTDVPGLSDGESLGVQQAHQSGITGEDVAVGIIDEGFNPENQAIESNVVDTRSFRNSRGDPAHGTSVAEIVTRTAPDSQLYLVSTSTGTDTEAAIDYLRRQDVDIIIHSVGFPAFEDNGNHIFTNNINAATESGTLFVNAAGNEAQTHWEGDFRDTDDNDNHEWTQNGDELNCLPNCNTEYSGDVTVIVRWSDLGSESHYRAALLNPATDEYIAVDDDDDDRVFTTASGTKYTVLGVDDIPSQPVDLVIDHVSGPTNDEIEVTVFEGPREIQQNIPASSISAPADVPAALAVAAYEVGPRQLAPYSSRGPTDDGRTGIDVTGYTNIAVTNGLYGSEEFVFTGTSAAAPYVGGVAALVEENQAGDQSPAELTSTLKSASDDILDVGTDTASGSGVVHAEDAVGVGVDATDLAGDGTESNPYQISNASELQAMEDDLDANYELVSDIDASNTAQFNDGSGFDPVGATSFDESTPPPFTGSFDSNNQTITGLTINRPDEVDIGLFGRSEGRVSHLVLTNLTVTGNDFVGGLVGDNRGTVRNVTVSGDVSGANATGGVVGFNDGAMQDATVSGSVTGSNAVGGVVGNNHGTIQTATASGDVSSSGRINVGGLVGFANNQSDIQNVTASGDVDGPDLVGGLVGQSRGTITDATASGDVSGDESVGGLVGDTGNESVITNATASGEVSGSGTVGGVVGGADLNTRVQNTTASGDITGIENVGGVVGYVGNKSIILNSTASGSVSGESEVGGAIGDNRGKARNVRASGDTNGGTFVGGVVGELNHGTIQNATASGDVSGDNSTGGVVGFVDQTSTVQHTTASGTVNGLNAVGGLAGQNRGTIQTAEASGDVSGTGTFNVGGLVGFAGINSTTQNVTASGDVTGPDLVGGLIGQHQGTAQNVTASGDVTGVNETGGLIGFSNGTVTTATASGTVTGVDNVGGLIGQSNGEITIATASGNINGESDVGGLVGANAGRIQHTTASGDITGGEFAGGLLGVHIGIAQESFAVGAVTATGTTDAGGLVADRSRLGERGTVTGSYWDRNATTQSGSIGNATGLTTAQMTGGAAATNMDGLDFQTTWTTTDGYPALRALSGTDQADETPPPLTATVQLDSAPNGLQRYNISVEGPPGSSITTIEPGVISNTFQIRSGGEGDSTVTARAVDLTETVGQSSDPVRLYEAEFEFEGTLERSDLTVTATDLTNNNDTTIPTDLLTVTTPTSAESEGENPVIVGDTPATDTDADGLFEDVNGDGEANFADGISLAFNIDAASSNRESFDFDADGDVDFDDAISLVFQV